jgi:hypothetical protein
MRHQPWDEPAWWRRVIAQPYERGDPRALPTLKALLRPLLLRRTKAMKDVDGKAIVVLPPKREHMEWLVLSEAERTFYDAIFSRSKATFQGFEAAGTILNQYAVILSLLLRLRQACNHPYLVLGRRRPKPGSASAGGAADQADEEEGDGAKDGAGLSSALVTRLLKRFMQSESALRSSSSFPEAHEHAASSSSSSAGGGGGSSISVGRGRVQAEAAAVLSPHVLSMISGLKSKGWADEECPICLEEVTAPVLTSCAHLLCDRCLRTALQSAPERRCPVCRCLLPHQSDIIPLSAGLDPSATSSGAAGPALSTMQSIEGSYMPSSKLNTFFGYLDSMERHNRRCAKRRAICTAAGAESGGPPAPLLAQDADPAAADAAIAPADATLEGAAVREAVVEAGGVSKRRRSRRGARVQSSPKATTPTSSLPDLPGRWKSSRVSSMRSQRANVARVSAGARAAASRSSGISPNQPGRESSSDSSSDDGDDDDDFAESAPSTAKPSRSSARRPQPARSSARRPQPTRSSAGLSSTGASSPLAKVLDLLPDEGDSSSAAADHDDDDSDSDVVISDDDDSEDDSAPRTDARPAAPASDSEEDSAMRGGATSRRRSALPVAPLFRRSAAAEEPSAPASDACDRFGLPSAWVHRSDPLEEEDWPGQMLYSKTGIYMVPTLDLPASAPVSASASASASSSAITEQLHGVAEDGSLWRSLWLEDAKCVYFSLYTTMLDVVAEGLRRRGTRFCRIDGSMSQPKRDAALAAFAQEDGPTVLLVSTKAGGQGLTIVQACVVVVGDPWWTFATEQQAVARVHRIGQRRSVTVKRLVCKDTVEAALVELQQSKQQLANSALEAGASASTGKLTMEDLKRLFR